MEQNEFKGPGGALGVLEEDNSSGSARASSSNASESKGSKKPRGTILDASGDPAQRSAALDGIDGLTADTAQLIKDKPLGAAISALGIGLLLGLVLGILIGRD